MVHARQAPRELHPQTPYVCPRVCVCAGVMMCAAMPALPFPPTLPVLPVAANPYDTLISSLHPLQEPF